MQCPFLGHTPGALSCELLLPPRWSVPAPLHHEVGSASPSRGAEESMLLQESCNLGSPQGLLLS